VYVIYTIKQMANDLDRSERTVKTALRELENAGLITRIRQGWNQANRIFLQIPDRVQISSRPEDNICPMDVQDSSPCMGQNLPASNTDTEYKEHSKTEKVESTRRRYGEFQNVFLSGEECTRLEAAYPGKAAEYIERLSRYMASNDRHYANHYATIKKWLDEDSKGRSAKNYTYDDNEGECL
jgi:DNA-binding Lrp family transcriptional regulator